jgi:hypothetical protein
MLQGKRENEELLIIIWVDQNWRLSQCLFDLMKLFLSFNSPFKLMTSLQHISDMFYHFIKIWDKPS